MYSSEQKRQERRSPVVVNDPDARTHAAGEPLASQLPSRRLRGPYVRLTRASAPYQPQQSIILAGRREREAHVCYPYPGLGWAGLGCHHHPARRVYSSAALYSTVPRANGSITGLMNQESYLRDLDSRSRYVGSQTESSGRRHAVRDRAPPTTRVFRKLETLGFARG